MDVVAFWVAVGLVVVLVVNARLAHYRVRRARARQVTTWRPPVTFIRPGRPWGWQDRTPAGRRHGC